MSGDHSNLSPSGAERWSNCPGSVKASEGIEDKSNKYSAEGVVAHAIAFDLLMDKTDELTLISRIGEIVHEDGFDVEITEEMIEGAVEYRDTILADKAELEADHRPSPVVLKAETKIAATSIDKEVYGTTDALLYRKGDTMNVYDYKFGQNIVDPEENDQEAIYAVAAQDDLDCRAFDKVSLVIIQPRGRHIDGAVRRWLIPDGWLEQFRARMKEAAGATRKPDAPLVAGSWCLWCPAKVDCTAVYTKTQNQAQVDFQVIPAPPAVKEKEMVDVSALPHVRSMPLKKLAAALDWEDPLKAWLGAIKHRLQEELEAGKHVPGYKLVDSRTNRQWGSEDQVVAALTGLVEPADMFEQKLLTITQAEKLISKKRLKELNITFKPPSRKTIARDKDPRPIAKSSASEDFSPIDPVSYPSREALCDCQDGGHEPDCHSHPVHVAQAAAERTATGNGEASVFEIPEMPEDPLAVQESIEAELLGADPLAPPRRKPIWP